MAKRLEHDLPKGYSSRGADMGRMSDSLNSAAGQRVRLQRMHLDSGGYDAMGAYWGLPSNLYVAAWAYTEDGEKWICRAFFRAESRDAAKTQVLKEAPDAKFYR